MTEMSCLVPTYSQFRHLIVRRIYVYKSEQSDDDMLTWGIVSTEKPDRYCVDLIVTE